MLHVTGISDKKPRKRPGNVGKVTAGKSERTPYRHFCQILKIMSGGLAKIPELCYNTVATRLNTPVMENTLRQRDLFRNT